MDKKTFEDFKHDIENLFSTHEEEFNKLKAQIDAEEVAKKENKSKKESKEKAGTNVTDTDTNEGFLKLGEKLAQADKELNTEDFKKLKDSVFGQLGKSCSSSLNKVIKIAKHPQLQNSEYRSRLPAGWGTLAIISTLKECEFDVFIADKTITSETSRLDITAKVNAAKGKEKTKSYTIRMDKNKAEDKVLSLEEVKNMLKGTGWELVIPKAK
ncbi:MAG: hypothetical protein NTZ45_01725 [Methylococcales bacterium]|nr:hypothetical protein [Methylococcales bacterium]